MDQQWICIQHIHIILKYSNIAVIIAPECTVAPRGVQTSIDGGSHVTRTSLGNCLARQIFKQNTIIVLLYSDTL